jgi:hypothetical protein
MTPPGSRWRGIAWTGCAILGLIGLVGLGVGTFYFGGLFARAGEAEKTATALAEQFGAPDDYTPSPGGVAAERIEAFLAVRRVVEGHCPTLVALGEQLRPLRDADASKKQPSAGGILSILGGSMRLGPVTVDLLTARNEALLANHMGMGEYVYLYALAYQSGPVAPEPAWLFPHEMEHTTDGRERLLGILGRLAKAARSTPGAVVPAEAVDAEIARLEADPARRLWAEGLPAGLREPLAARATDIATLYCPAAAQFDLAEIERHAVSIHIDDH